MKIGKGGYTILEVMMFLAISAGLVTLAMRNFTGRQETVQFSQGVGDVAQIFSATSNDIRTGFSGGRDLTCTDFTITTGGTDVTGSNEACAFLGKIIVVAPVASGSLEFRLHVFTVVGKSLVGVPEDQIKLATYHSVNAKVVHANSGVDRNGVEGGLSMTDSRDMPWSIKWVNQPASSLAIGYLNGLYAKNYSTRVMVFDSADVKAAVSSGNLNTIATALEFSMQTPQSGDRFLVPGAPGAAQNSAVVCLKRPDGGQAAVVRIGSASDQLLAEPVFDGDCNV